MDASRSQPKPCAKTGPLVWDWPVRLGHGLMIVGFALAWLTSEGERWALVHAGAGATVLAVAIFRVFWGFAGSRHARFSDFVVGPGKVFAYLRSLLGPRPEYSLGHNPAGGWAIVLLLLLALASGITGWLNYLDIGASMLEGVHLTVATALLALVAVHLLGVVLSSFLHHENLPRAMLTGRKSGEAGKDPGADPIEKTHPWAALALLVWVGLAGWLIVA